MGWTYLGIAVVFEIAWASTLKSTEGYTRPGPTAINLILCLANLFVLSQALKLLPTALAYSVWTGLGACGVALVGYFLQGESFGSAKVASIGMILLGVVGLRFFSTA